MIRLIGSTTARQGTNFQWWSANRDKIYQVVLYSNVALKYFK